ncbi:Electron transfer flavoprotein-ubiquinone oxidoreductase [Mycena sanguinolenta]|uniref:Electron transfer flavoprotein-ubiquinone oxidoreductase n=1 Tax=Mycena sanguinolenta TaxID=230812 RepID=A0A8H6X628_9AGAR|nr:Electron transfer flavoprotein-ubiquinone oxidoreductase [Mycena sanguinolenta]
MAACKPIEYPAFEPPLSTDLMSRVALTGTTHNEGEAVHLRVMRGECGDDSFSLFESDDACAHPPLPPPTSTRPRPPPGGAQTSASTSSRTRACCSARAPLLRRSMSPMTTGGRVVPGNAKGKEANNEGEEDGEEG